MPPTTPLSLSDLQQFSQRDLEQWSRQTAQNRDLEGLCLLVDHYVLTAGRKQAYTSPRTLLSYHRGLKDYLTWVGDTHTDLLHPGRRNLALYLTHLKSRPLHGRSGQPSQATAALYLAAARTLYRALHWAGALDVTPDATHVPTDPTRSAVRHPPYPDSLESVYAHADPTACALLLLCDHGGLRIAEALSVTAHDVQGRHLLVHGKGGTQRRVPLSARLRAALDQLTPHPTTGRYFTWTYDQAAYRMKRLFGQAGLPWRGFHAARKSAATRLYRQTHDFTRVALFLGHASADTTRWYVLVDEDDLTAEVEDW
ncbi:tyrosine-type recombinase/integrase [Deinococcus radiotolerans]|uniref:Integrase n=1 Tax=Deinococcus radiotolerans TaxID=1309407 RepID=A0ABQ2FP48_9DEIO|nr:site-specific integrase [Deinococcus radiotolerans]GGL13161.1 integrase [Deinococcus radiotolerans]